MVLTFDLLKSKPLSSSLHAHTLYIHVLDLSLIKICFVIGVTKSQGRQAENIMPQSQLCWRRHYKKKKSENLLSTSTGRHEIWQNDIINIHTVLKF